MFQAFRRWLSGDASSGRKLVVEGEIVEAGTHEPRTHLGPKQPPPEAWFALRLSSAQLSDGSPEPLDRVVPPEFSGPRELLEQYAVGDRVRITATTATGRQIE
jgi:hypothetical protein